MHVWLLELLDLGDVEQVVVIFNALRESCRYAILLVHFVDSALRAVPRLHGHPHDNGAFLWVISNTDVVTAHLLGTWTPMSLYDTVAKTVIPHDLRGIWTFVGYTAVLLRILVNRVLFFCLTDDLAEAQTFTWVSVYQH